MLEKKSPKVFNSIKDKIFILSGFNEITQMQQSITEHVMLSAHTELNDLQHGH